MTGARIPSRLILTSAFVLVAPLAAQVTPWTVHVGNQAWDSANAVDIVILGDNYLVTEKNLFYDPTGGGSGHVKKAVDALLSIEPYKTYRDFLKIHAVFHASPPGSRIGNERGSNNITATSIYKCTLIGALNSSLARIDDRVQAQKDAMKAPGYDGKYLMLINTDLYAAAASVGGDCSLCSVFTNQPWTWEDTAVHEIGHNFGNLGDEYCNRGSGGYPGGPIDPGIVNLDKTSSTRDVRWSKWTPTTGLPIAGGNGFCSGIWHPRRFHCLMETQGVNQTRQHCEVCREELTMKILDRADSFAGYTGPRSPITTPWPSTPTTFLLKSLPSLPVNHPFVPQWFLNGSPIGTAGALSATVGPGSSNPLIPNQDNVVECKITAGKGGSTFIHGSTTDSRLVATKRWEFHIDKPAVQVTLAGNLPNPLPLGGTVQVTGHVSNFSKVAANDFDVELFLLRAPGNNTGNWVGTGGFKVFSERMTLPPFGIGLFNYTFTPPFLLSHYSGNFYMGAYVDRLAVLDERDATDNTAVDQTPLQISSVPNGTLALEFGGQTLAGPGNGSIIRCGVQSWVSRSTAPNNMPLAITAPNKPNRLVWIALSAGNAPPTPLVPSPGIFIPLKNDFWYQVSLHVLFYGYPAGPPYFNRFVHTTTSTGASPGIGTLTLLPASIMPSGTYHFAVGFVDPTIRYFDAASTGAMLTISK